MKGYYLSVFRFQAIQTLLNDVIAIEILNKFDNFTLKCMHNSLNLWRVSATGDETERQLYLFSG